MAIWHRQITFTMIRRSFNKTIYNNVYTQYKPPKNNTTRQQSAKWAISYLSVYRFVFTTNLAFWATLLLCISLLLQPVAFVFGQEATDQPDAGASLANPDEQTSVAASESDVVPNQDDIGSDKPDGQLDLEVGVKDEGTSSPDTQSSLEPQSDTVATSTSTPTVESGSISDQSQVSTTTATALTLTSTSTSTDSTSTGSVSVSSASGTSSVVDTATSLEPVSTTDDQSSSVDTDDILDSTTNTTTLNNGALDGIDDAIATATPVTSAGSQVVSTVQTDNVLAFNKNECTEVEDGSFYCQKVSYDTIAKNDLFAAPDATGDMEIYVVQDGEQIKVTDNAVDDASPFYDSRSKTIVWHRLINDRYQIVSYDVETGEENQITDTNVNDMEPTRSGDYTVWQRWVQNNWEIMLRTGDIETQITDSVEHDIAPHIRGDLIIWNVRSSDGTQSLMTYDIGSQVFNEIKDTDGVSVSNPRMLVMYEAQYQNGDTVMKGYDLVTGEIIPIERFPQDLPSDIPSPEATGEVRALPTNPQLEEELSSDTDLDTDEPGEVPVQYDEDDLVLSASSTATATTTPVVEAVEYDLDLRTIETNQSTTTSDLLVEQAAIPDVVIPGFEQGDDLTQASSTQDN